jgi:hypothetical protein
MPAVASMQFGQRADFDWYRCKKSPDQPGFFSN